MPNKQQNTQNDPVTRTDTQAGGVRLGDFKQWISLVVYLATIIYMLGQYKAEFDTIRKGQAELRLVVLTEYERADLHKSDMEAINGKLRMILETLSRIEDRQYSKRD